MWIVGERMLATGKRESLSLNVCHISKLEPREHGASTGVTYLETPEDEYQDQGYALILVPFEKLLAIIGQFENVQDVREEDPKCGRSH